MTPTFEISIDGTDVTEAFGPVLISLTTRQSTEGVGSFATADIELDDTEAQLEVPRMGADVEIALGYDGELVEVFTGTINNNSSKGTTTPGKRQEHQKGHVASQGNRQQGRVLVITANSADQTESEGKSPKEFHKDNCTFSEFINELAGKAGLQAKTDDTIGQIKRDYWYCGNESFFACGARYMRELGGTMQMFSTTATFTSRNSGQSVSGQDLTGIEATWGYNLIAWSIQPVIGRPVFSVFRSRWYDQDAAAWKTEEAQGGSGSSSGPAHTGGFKAASSDNAQQNSGSNSAASDQDKGEADEVTIEGDPTAQCNAMCDVVGIRDGVDGTYQITSVTHHLSRQSGFITSLGLNRPQGDSSGGST